MTIRTPVKYNDIVQVSVPSNDGENGIKVASLKSKVSLEPGQLILKSPLIYTHLLKTKDFTTVQAEDKGHFKFDNEFEYMNHSCDPTTALLIDVKPSGETHVNVKVLKKINPGDDITFFYPSTEWHMDEAFECWCGADNCVKSVQGAKFIDTEVLKKNREKWGITDYTLKAKEKEDAEK